VIQTFLLTFWIFGHIVYDPVYRYLKKEAITTNKKRQAILQLLDERGVAHLREIERAINSGFFGVMWHLQVLEDFGHVRHRRIGNYLVYYRNDYRRVDTSTPELTFLFKNQNVRDIMIYIMNHPGTYQAEIARAIGLHHTAVRYYLQQLNEHELLESFSDGRKTQYFLLDGKGRQVNTILSQIQPEPD